MINDLVVNVLYLVMCVCILTVIRKFKKPFVYCFLFVLICFCFVCGFFFFCICGFCGCVCINIYISHFSVRNDLTRKAPSGSLTGIDLRLTVHHPGTYDNMKINIIIVCYWPKV